MLLELGLMRSCFLKSARGRGLCCRQHDVVKRAGMLRESGCKYVCSRSTRVSVGSWFISAVSDLVVEWLRIRIAGSVALESGQLEHLPKSHTKAKRKLLDARETCSIVLCV
jgi:hypothetical protein